MTSVRSQVRWTILGDVDRLATVNTKFRELRSHPCAHACEDLAKVRRLHLFGVWFAKPRLHLPWVQVPKLYPLSVKNDDFGSLLRFAKPCFLDTLGHLETVHTATDHFGTRGWRFESSRACWSEPRETLCFSGFTVAPAR